MVSDHFVLANHVVSDEALACKLVHDALVSSVKSRVQFVDHQHDHTVGFFLSGGLDSSLVAAIGASKGSHTFSIGMDKNQVNRMH